MKVAGELFDLPGSLLGGMIVCPRIGDVGMVGVPPACLDDEAECGQYVAIT